MNSLSFFVTLLFLLLVYSWPCLSSSSSSVTTSKLFQDWCEKHGKSYPSEEERLYRLGVFEDNLDFVTKHNNLGNSSYTLSLNAFADLTHHEFKATRLGFSHSLMSSKPKLASKPLPVRDVPASLDWRNNGAVTNVKDQGSCGACWSFSATGAIEGINKIVTGSLISLSEQELVDCDTNYNTGCNGGLMDYAYKFVVNNHGIDTEKDYPFHAKQQSCNKQKLNRHVVTIDGYTDVPENDENQLLQAVVKQPVSVGICGSERAFQLYSKGIFTGPCSANLDHAVLIVGYGSENGVDYWIVKNSWGTQWGMEGYIHLQRNGGSKQGLCGINMLASYPTKSGPNPPPSPPPVPTKCSIFTSCQGGETCCCASEFFGICFSWRCCPLNSAVCCKDHLHCCPQDYPVCDTARNQCLKRSGSNATSEALEFGKSGLWSSIAEGWVF